MLTCKEGHKAVMLPLPPTSFHRKPASQPHQGGESEHRVPSTSLVQNIADEVFLAIVGCEDGNLLRGITLQSHIHVQSHCKLCLPEVLQETVQDVCQQALCTDTLVSHTSRKERLEQTLSKQLQFLVKDDNTPSFNTIIVVLTIQHPNLIL